MHAPSEPPLLHLEEVASSNDELMALAAAGAVTGTALSVRRQSAGRGRRGRDWQTLPGRHVLVSVLHRSRLQASQLSGLTLDIGVAVAAVVDVLGLHATLKWPNDIQLDGKKVGGILCELVDTQTGPSVIVGLGLNVQAVVLPPELAQATTLGAALPDDVELDLETLTIDLVRAIRRACSAYDDRAAPDIGAWQARSVSLGRRVRQVLADPAAFSPGSAILAAVREGRVTGVAADGALLVHWDGDAAPERFVAGELEHLVEPG